MKNGRVAMGSKLESVLVDIVIIELGKSNYLHD